MVLDELQRFDIQTYAMVALVLPGAENLEEAFARQIDYVIIDRMNYNHADWVHRK